MTRSHVFSRALRQLHVIASSFDWFIVLPVRFLCDQLEYLLWFWFYDTELENHSIQTRQLRSYAEACLDELNAPKS